MIDWLTDWPADWRISQEQTQRNLEIKIVRHHMRLKNSKLNAFYCNYKKEKEKKKNEECLKEEL